MEIIENGNEPEMKDLIEMLNNIWPNRKEGSAELKNKLSSMWTRKTENVNEPMGIHQEDRIWIMGVPARSSRIGRKGWALHNLMKGISMQIQETEQPPLGWPPNLC